MKLKEKLKKGFSILEISIVMGAVAILTGASIGIYFGVTNTDPEVAAVSVQSQVVDLWKAHINNGTEYSSNLEAKAREFCTGYVEEQGVNVQLNYRVLEFDTFISAIPNESGIFRAYDPSSNAKEAVFIKIESQYPSYFISTATSVLEVSAPYETDELFNQAVIDNMYVDYSEVLDSYNISSATDDFTSFYELTEINYNGKTVRGIKYIRYNVLNSDNEVYATVFGRANRSLDDDCEGTYLPKSFGFNGSSGTIIHTSVFRLIETREDGQHYNYDPDHIYEYESNVHNDSLRTYEYLDANGNLKTKEAAISPSNSEYLIDSRHINFYPVIGNNGTNGGQIENPSEPGNGDPDQPSIDINRPIPDEEMPDIDLDNDATFDDNVAIEEYPITLAFAEEIKHTSLGDKIIAWFQSWFGIKEFTFKYLYFSTIPALNEFINNLNYGDLLANSNNEVSYIHFAHGLEISTTLNVPKKFVCFIDENIDTNPEVRKDNIDEFISNHKNSFTTIEKMDQIKYQRVASDPYKVHYPEAPSKLIHITNTGILNFTNNAEFYIESTASVTSYNKDNNTPYGWTVMQYAEVENDGAIYINGTSKARITGILSGKGIVYASDAATIAEPFKITDYFGESPTANLYLNRGIFPSDFYYLDSIRCELKLVYGSKYVGLIALNTYYEYDWKDFVEGQALSNGWYTFGGNVNIISEHFDNSIFAMSPNSTLIKSCDDNGHSTFELVKGNLTYSKTEISTIYHRTFLSNDIYDGYNTFNTETTGFKLSNISLIINNGTKLSFPGVDYSGELSKLAKVNNLPKFEILPSSSVQIKNSGLMEVGKNVSIFVDNYYDTGSNVMHLNGRSNVHAYTDIRNSILSSNNSDVLLSKFNYLKTIFDNTINLRPMLSIKGNLIINLAKINNQTLSETESDWKSCEFDITSLISGIKQTVTRNIGYMVSGIHMWNNNRVNGISNIILESNYWFPERTETGKVHHCDDIKVFGYVVTKGHTYKQYYNDVVYNVLKYKYGGSSSCEAVPQYSALF